MKRKRDNDKNYYLNTGYEILVKRQKFVTDGKFLYHYDGIWRRIDSDNTIRIMRKIIEKEFAEQGDFKMNLSTPNMAKRIYEAIKTSPEIREIKINLNNSPIVAIENGKTILDLSTMKTRLIKPEDRQFWAFDYAYKPSAKWSDAPKFCEFVKKSIGIDLEKGNCGNNKRKHLLEIIAYLCTNIFGAKKMFVFLGPPSSGKSVMLRFLKDIIGEGNFAPLALSDLGDKFRAQLLENVHVIINDELPCRGVRNLDILKKVISCEELVVEKKKGTPFTFRPTVKVVFAANQLPRLDEYDSDNAFAERMTVLRFSKTIPQSEWQTNLAECLFGERDAIISCALKEVRPFITHPTEFTEDKEGLAVLKECENENDSVNQFIHDPSICTIDKVRSNLDCRVSVKDLFDGYVRYCDENAISAASMATFRQQMAQLGFEHHKLRYRGRSVSCFTGIRLATDCMLTLNEKGTNYENAFQFT